MRQYLIGLAAAAAVAVVSAPAMASCGGCAAPAVSYSSCYNPCGGGFGGGSSWGYATLPAPVQYYSVQQQPQYYYVNQGPTYTGPGMYAPVASYQQRAVYGYNGGYGGGYSGYNGGPYANPVNHGYYGAPAYSTPTVYSYRRAYRPYYRPAVRYGYSQRMYAPRHSFRYGHRHHVAPRYSVAPHQYGPRPRVLRRYY